MINNGFGFIFTVHCAKSTYLLLLDLCSLYMSVSRAYCFSELTDTLACDGIEGDVPALLQAILGQDPDVFKGGPAYNSSEPGKHSCIFLNINLHRLQQCLLLFRNIWWLAWTSRITLCVYKANIFCKWKHALYRPYFCIPGNGRLCCHCFYERFGVQVLHY